jgi:HSP20 family protein
MTNRDLTRYTPGGIMPLSEAMNQLLHEAFTTPFGFGAGRMLGADMNLYETDDSYVVQVPLPGIQLDQLNITARENTVTLQGTTEIPAPEGARGLHMGTARGQFFEQVQLPSDVDAERASATYDNGILTLTLPRAPSARARAIRVTEGRQERQIQGPRQEQMQQPMQDRGQAYRPGAMPGQGQGQGQGAAQGSTMQGSNMQGGTQGQGSSQQQGQGQARSTSPSQS